MIARNYRVLYYLKDKDFFAYEFIFKVLKVLTNYFYPLLYRNRRPRVKNTEVERKEEIIVSLTTFPPRINTVWQTINTLLSQTMKPDHIVLWLAKGEFDSLDELPTSLKRLMEHGLEIRFCDDIKSHKKYYYAMKEYPNAVIITVDDDVYYPTDLVENLYKKHLEFPNAICCNWAHKIVFNSGKIGLYGKWEKGVSGHDKNPDSDIVQIGYEGVLYPANSLASEVFDKEKIMNLSPTADDLWLKFMAVLKDTPVVRTRKDAIRFFEIMKAQTVALNQVNTFGDQNDIAIDNITKEYPEICYKLGKMERNRK